MAINFTSLATSALAFTLALAWNDAVVKTIASVAPLKDDDKKSKAHMTVVYAAIVTVLVLLVIAVINGGRALYLRLSGGAPPRPAKADLSPVVQLFPIHM
jgi:hypothetical protein